MRYLRSAASVFLLALLSASALGIENYCCYWYWQWKEPFPVHGVAGWSKQRGHEFLTDNSGAHAVSMTKYGSDPVKVWVNIVSTDKPDASPSTGWRAFAHQFGDYFSDAGDTTTIKYSSGHHYTNVCVSAVPDVGQEPDGRKVVTFCENVQNDNNTVHACADNLQTIDRPWPYFKQLSPGGNLKWDAELTSAVVMENYNNGRAIFPFGYEEDEKFYEGLMEARTANGGVDWQDASWVHPPVEAGLSGPYRYGPSICKGAGGDLHLAYRTENAQDTILYRKYHSSGSNWDSDPKVLGDFNAYKEPCIACSRDGNLVVICWTKEDGSESRICFRWSTNGGDDWNNSGVSEVPLDYSGPTRYSHPNISIEETFGVQSLIMVCAVKNATTTGVRAAFGKWRPNASPSGWYWNRYPWMTTQYAGIDDDLDPSVATMDPWDGYNVPRGFAAWSLPFGGGARYLYASRGEWAFWSSWGTADGANPGRNVTIDAAGNVHYVSLMKPYVIGGPVVGAALTPVMQDVGCQPALALDGDNEPWTAYLRGDSLFCKLPGGVIRSVFCGSSSAIPGQPSIVCYPIQVNGAYVANVVFPVYDTAGGTSKIMYARVDTSAVVLDTIESAANLRDSLPCINIYKTDSLLVTWQHGDSTLSSMLADYGPGTAGQVPAWSSPSLVTATGYHPMSVMENGSVLNCSWTQKSGSNYSIERASCDLASAMFGSWTSMATPGGSSSAEKANSVYAGAGVSVWQQKDANGKWIIKGFVRGAETTFVANDTDAYHPHAVAESSAISPSIDQVRVHLLYTAGVAFEVDSGVYDTGETRYVCESLNVSHAGSEATKYNNGAKLVRKNGSDSLFAVYGDADGAVAFAWSAAGDSWRREIMTTGRSYPTIAEDSTGKRWVVVTKPVLGMVSSAVEAYYRNGSSWTGPQTLYTNAVVTIGPASLAGASSTTSSIAYAAFLNTSGMTKSVILAKFNGTSVSTYTVATGSSLGNPSLTVEPYKADSDHVHVTWEDNGTIKYRMDTDGRSTSIASNWTSIYDLTGMGIVAHHPSINSDHDQIVAAWAQGTPADVYSRKRSTASAYNNWDAAVDLSNTAQDASDYPTIAMGDTVVVAWEEMRTGGSDFDILASIDFGDTLNIADNATFSTYPHVLFQNKTSGDTTIPYLHTIWSECPPANYFEVGYNKLNLKQASGEGQQSASSIPIPVKPMLASCSPNPFRNHTQINYALPSAGNVSLRVYDVTGRTVRTLASGHQKAGSYSVNWDARDNRGKQVPYGVYFYRLDTPGFRSVKKAVVAR
jgi:hypothetical protein